MSPAEMESDKMVEVEVEVEAAAADPDECTASGGDPKACADCNTTKTPLWRGGPNGPKTLCNACGIRYRKRRRVAMGLDPEAKRKPKRDDAIKAAAATPEAAAEAPTKEEDKAGDDSKAGNDNKAGDDKASTKKAKTTTTTHTVELHMVGFAKDAVLKQRRRRMRQRRKPSCLGEEERAAILLMSLSSGVIYA